MPDAELEWVAVKYEASSKGQDYSIEQAKDPWSDRVRFDWKVSGPQLGNGRVVLRHGDAPTLKAAKAAVAEVICGK